MSALDHRLTGIFSGLGAALGVWLSDLQGPTQAMLWAAGGAVAGHLVGHFFYWFVRRI